MESNEKTHSKSKYAPKRPSTQYFCKYSGLSLEEKIIKDLYGSPKKIIKLLESINGNSARTGVTKDQLYSKLLDMKRDGKVYRVEKRPNAKSGRTSINDYKWFLESDFVVEQAVEGKAEQ